MGWNRTKPMIRCCFQTLLFISTFEQNVTKQVRKLNFHSKFLDLHCQWMKFRQEKIPRLLVAMVATNINSGTKFFSTKTTFSFLLLLIISFTKSSKSFLKLLPILWGSSGEPGCNLRCNEILGDFSQFQLARRGGGGSSWRLWTLTSWIRLDRSGTPPFFSSSSWSVTNLFV